MRDLLLFLFGVVRSDPLPRESVQPATGPQWLIAWHRGDISTLLRGTLATELRQGHCIEVMACF
jgi:hypothetical protein